MDRKIGRLVVNNPFMTSTSIFNELRDYNGSKRTIKRRLNAMGLMGRAPSKKPLISARNRKARIAFAKRHLNWTKEQWKKVLFSDESRFKLFNSDGRHFVWRPKGQRFNPKYTLKTVKHSGGSVMVWGSFHARGIGPLVRIDGIMDRFLYRDILSDHMLPFAEDNLPLTWIFQQDNDPKHKSRLVMQWLADRNVQLLDWPSQSPDLNPIEHLWDYVARTVSSKKSSNLNELFEKIQEIWQNIPQSVIDKLIESMPRRCQAVIKAQGFATRY